MSRRAAPPPAFASALVAAAAYSLSACATPRPPAPEPPAFLAMEVARGDGLTCRIRVAGRRFTLPAGEAALLAFLRPRSGPDRELVLSGGPDTPYRCIAHAVELGHRAGFPHIGFLSEPAPDAER